MKHAMRLLLPVVALIIWLGVSGIGGPYFGKLSEVQDDSVVAFLPASAESTRVSHIQEQFEDDTQPIAILVATHDEGLSAEALEFIEAFLADVGELAGVAEISPAIPSTEVSADELPMAVQAFAFVSADPADTVELIRGASKSLTAEHGIEVFITGPAAVSADLSAAFAGIDGRLLMVALVAVFIILLCVYRSPVLPLLVLISSVGALALAILVSYFLADAGVIQLNAQVQGILFILVIGAATDYALLLIARYRENLRTTQDHRTALLTALRKSLRPILASAGTVTAGLLCLLLSDLNSNRYLGPVAAVGIVSAVLATGTFLPALLVLTGRAAFFPFASRVAVSLPDAAPIAEHANTEADHIPSPANPPMGKQERAGVWDRLARTTAKHPRRLWLTTTIVLVAFAAFAPTFSADGVPRSEVLMGTPDSVTGQEVLGEFFSAGSGSPASVIAPADRIAEVQDLLKADSGITAVTVRTEDSTGAPGEGEMIVVDVSGVEMAELQATLGDPADSDAAISTIERIRVDLDEIDPAILVGGATAADLDTRVTATRDLQVIIPAVLIIITLILMLVLHSLLAPILLVATTVLSYLATVGLAALIFTHVFGFPGADPTVPLYSFLFLVALGIDYNIFLATRVREEALHVKTPLAVLTGLRVTGGVITSAGIVLAATFAALSVIPLLFMVQLAFIVSVGVLIDTFIVRSLLVPGLMYELGDRVWWPAKMANRRSTMPGHPTG